MSLTSAELTMMRDAVNELLPGTASILTLTRTSDGQGGWSDAWAASGTASCRLDNRSKTEALQGGGIQHYTEWVLTVPYDTTVTVSNRVQVDGTQYNILGIDSGKSWPVSLRLTLGAA